MEKVTGRLSSFLFYLSVVLVLDSHEQLNGLPTEAIIFDVILFVFINIFFVYKFRGNFWQFFKFFFSRINTMFMFLLVSLFI